jgi:uncharacterized membrane protein
LLALTGLLLCLYLGLLPIWTTWSARVGDRMRDECWKLGLFYVNPDDSAVFVEKRFGIGYTVNFGKLRVWIALAVIVALLVLMRILTR